MANTLPGPLARKGRPAQRPRRLAAVLAAAGAFAAVVGPAGPAQADEDERILSIYGGFASFAAGVGPDDRDTSTGVGAQLGVDYERGLTRAVWLRASAGGALYTGRPASAAGQATVGLTYVFDVFKYVPYAHLGVGGAALRLDRAPDADDADNGTELHPVVELGLGVDRLTSDNFSYGGHLRFQSFLDKTALFVAGIRISWRWGFF